MANQPAGGAIQLSVNNGMYHIKQMAKARKKAYQRKRKLIAKYMKILAKMASWYQMAAWHRRG